VAVANHRYFTTVSPTKFVPHISVPYVQPFGIYDEYVGDTVCRYAAISTLVQSFRHHNLLKSKMNGGTIIYPQSVMHFPNHLAAQSNKCSHEQPLQVGHPPLPIYTPLAAPSPETRPPPIHPALSTPVAITESTPPSVANTSCSGTVAAVQRLLASLASDPRPPLEP